MVVAAGTVYMTVFKLFRGGVANFDYGDIEIKGDTCQRVVAVNSNGVAFNLFDGDDDHLAVRPLGIELHTCFNFRFGRKHAAGYIL